MSSYGPQRGYSEYDDSYDSYNGYADSYAYDSYGADPYPADAYSSAAGRATGSAAVGSASTGRARVGAVPPAPESPAPGGHRYDWSGAGSRGPAGRASVPVSPSPGSGASGRARVATAGGGPAGPGGGPAARRPGDGRPRGKRKRNWLRNSLLAAFAVVVITIGGGMVALSYYVDSVPPPAELGLEEGSTIYYGNGKRMAVLQEVNREVIDTKIPELGNARDAIVAAEDTTFWEHSGVDFFGVVRAAFNNLSGGERQGASTIDQQYVGAAADIRDEATYSRKLKEAAMAYKFNQEHSKEEILDFYMNQVYFGRGAYGIQAAAKAYFSKRAKDLAVEEAAVLAGIIRLPDDGSTLSPYDPLHEAGPAAAEDRFRYVLGQMVNMGKLDEAAANQMQLPETVKPDGPDKPLKGPQGPLVAQIKRELEELGIEDLSTGGYRITTTINQKLQRIARETARRKSSDLVQRYPKNVKAALVAIAPQTGGVLAYYGGEDGTGVDWAGPYYANGTLKGGWSPGSTMKIYTLIAALRDGVSFDSKWKTSNYEPEWADITVNNAGRTATSCPGGDAPDNCPLRWATQQSYNVPFAHYSERVPNREGPAHILRAARDAGVQMIKGQDDEVHVIAGMSDEELTNNIGDLNIDHPVAYGQYPITVLDHANGVATLAARGVYHEHHFVKKVEQKNENGEWVQTHGDQIKGEQRIEQPIADAITDVLSTIPGDPIMGHPLADRPAAAKTGTWEHTDENGELDGNSAAWVVGYTPQIAAAVWTGNPKNQKILDQYGGSLGSNELPAEIWQAFMNAVHGLEKYQPVEAFPPANPVGDQFSELANGEEPEQDRGSGFCRRFPQFPGCEDEGGDGGDEGGAGGLEPNGDQDTGILPELPGATASPAPTDSG
jgi:membrane peptidoglycan carboxypeptidase